MQSLTEFGPAGGGWVMLVSCPAGGGWVVGLHGVACLLVCFDLYVAGTAPT